MTYLSSALRTFKIQIDALTSLSKNLDDSFTKACDLLLNCKGKVVVTGMGKSGHVGNKMAATFASTGTPSFFMHPGEANHGDFGMLGAQDVLIAISNSGESSEISGLLPSIKRIGVPVIAMTNNPSSSLAKYSHTTLCLHVNKEACSLGLAPTSSTTNTLVLGDALAIALLEAKGFTAEDFAFSHPGGALGKRLLLTVDDIMAKGNEVPSIRESALVSDAILEISSKGLGITAITDANNTLIGIFSDGDLRRSIDKKIDLHTTPVIQVMTSGGVSISPNQLAVDALNIMQEKQISALLAVNEDNEIVGALNMHMLLKAGVI